MVRHILVRTVGRAHLSHKLEAISLPDNVSADSPFGSYRLEFKRKGNTLHFKRTAVMNFNAMIPAAEHEHLKAFLNKVSKADAIQVLFYTK